MCKRFFQQLCRSLFPPRQLTEPLKLKNWARVIDEGSKKQRARGLLTWVAAKSSGRALMGWRCSCGRRSPARPRGTVPQGAQDTQRQSSVHQFEMGLPVVGAHGIDQPGPLSGPGPGHTSFPEAPSSLVVLFCFPKPIKQGF